MSSKRPQTEAELIEQVRSVDVQAPPELHARVRALIADAPVHSSLRAGTSGPRRPRFALPSLVGGAALAAVIAAVLIAGLGAGSGGGGDATLRTASRLTLSAATLPAPGESSGHGAATLDAQVDGVSFPYWEESFGWRATGARVDSIAGRPVRTVFYANPRGQRIGYAIVGGSPALGLHGGSVQWRGGTAYRELTLGGERVVAWLRDGRLCVVSGRGVPAATLLRLASWQRAGVT
jgi:hypothetical protein